MKFLRYSLAAMLLAGGGLTAAGDDPIGAAAMPHGLKADRTWKRYRNDDLSYCVDYPAKWARGDAFDGSGLFVQAGMRRFSRPVGEIDVGPILLASLEDARLKPAALRSGTPDADALDGSLQEHWSGLQKFSRAERLEVIWKRELKVQGYQALYAKNSYYDPLERRMWMEEVVFVNRKGEIYRLELQCVPDQIDRFEPVFAYLVKTLQFDCK